MIIEKPYKVAIIDDSASMRTLMESICLQNPSFEPLTFEDAEVALKVIEEQKIRVVLVDINMPTMFGDDVLRRCMQMKLGIQVYVVTGQDSVTIADRCFNVGARGMIPKSFAIEGCAKALKQTETFFEEWNQSMLYFLRHKTAG